MGGMEIKELSFLEYLLRATGRYYHPHATSKEIALQLEILPMTF